MCTPGAPSCGPCYSTPRPPAALPPSLPVQGDDTEDEEEEEEDSASKGKRKRSARKRGKGPVQSNSNAALAMLAGAAATKPVVPGQMPATAMHGMEAMWAVNGGAGGLHAGLTPEQQFMQSSDYGGNEVCRQGEGLRGVGGSRADCEEGQQGMSWPLLPAGATAPPAWQAGRASWAHAATRACRRRPAPRAPRLVLLPTAGALASPPLPRSFISGRHRRARGEKNAPQAEQPRVGTPLAPAQAGRVRGAGQDGQGAELG